VSREVGDGTSLLESVCESVLFLLIEYSSSFISYTNDQFGFSILFLYPWECHAWSTA